MDYVESIVCVRKIPLHIRLLRLFLIMKELYASRFNKFFILLYKHIFTQAGK